MSVGARGRPACAGVRREAGDLFRALKWRDERGRRIYGWYKRGAKAALDVARGLHYLVGGRAGLGALGPVARR